MCRLIRRGGSRCGSHCSSPLSLAADDCFYCMSEPPDSPFALVAGAATSAARSIVCNSAIVFSTLVSVHRPSSPPHWPTAVAAAAAGAAAVRGRPLEALRLRLRAAAAPDSAPGTGKLGRALPPGSPPAPCGKRTSMSLVSVLPQRSLLTIEAAPFAFR